MSAKTPIDLSNAVSPSLMRRLGAILYDTLLVAGLLLFASTLVTVPVDIFFGQEAAAQIPKNPLFTLFLGLVPPLFFIRFWLKGGQTLGMRTWKLMIIRQDGLPLTPRDALLRFIFATLSLVPLGIGLIWVLFDQEKLALHDRLSGTRLIILGK